MESDRILIGALIFILIIIGSNVVMYAIARGWAKGGDSRWMSALRDSLSKPTQSQSNKSMDELRKQVEELEKKKNGQ
ncbi:MAG TPA: hypothetical protein VFR47_32685 [Anaerolineales bacterium]|nr:hypothetical protein [Anaerolineales bacterium]